MTKGEPMAVLDSLERVQSLDSRNVFRLLHDMPEHCETALAIGRSLAVERFAIKPNVLLLVGVGDSGFAADVVAEVLADDVEVPVLTEHTATIPACVNEQSVVFIIDYLGNTPTSLRAYKAAQERGAHVVCVTSGGKLRESAAGSARVLSIPAGQPSRFGLVYMALAPIAAAQAMGLASTSDQKASAAILLAKNAREFLRFEVPTARNQAKQVAEMLFGKVPVVIGGSDYRALVGRRWVSEISANAKQCALTCSFNDLADGQVCAWEQLASDTCEPAFVYLVDELDWTTENETIRQASSEVLSKFTRIDLEMKGANNAERLIYGMYFGDYVSYYLALLREVDPYKTESARSIASRLAPRETATATSAVIEKEAGEETTADEI
ncbi:MAG: SIS domain-containing protein [Armatimonadota bacterium]|nr:SIS domain-containing protein [Armatimonadota bacterium]